MGESILNSSEHFRPMEGDIPEANLSQFNLTAGDNRVYVTKYITEHKTTTTAAWTLFIMLGFVAIMFYAVPSKNRILRTTTWEAMSQGLSILLALMFFYAMKDVTDVFLKRRAKKKDGSYGGDALF